MENSHTPPVNASRYLSHEELLKIERAVRLAESDISGEIVPVFVKRCSRYTLVKYRVGVLAFLFSFIALIIYDRLVASLPSTDPVFYFLVVTLSGAGAVALTYINPLGRLLAGKGLLKQIATRKAESIFLHEEVFRTKRRRGIMIFVAMFERCAIIRADKGITAVVPPEVWCQLEGELVAAIKNGQLFEGLIQAIARCGKLMEEYGFRIAEDDTDELPNSLRDHN